MKRVLAFLLILFILFTAGCQTEEYNKRPVLQDLQETKTLKLLLAEEAVYPEIGLFQEAFPDVELEIERVPSNELPAVLNAQIMAGQGPDVIFGNAMTFQDIEKAMSTGVFLDLYGLMNSDPEFYNSGYSENYINAGKSQGQQFFIPVQCTSPFLITGENILKYYGLEGIEKETEFSSFWNKIGEVALAEQKNLNSEEILCFFSLRALLTCSQIQLVNHETREILPDKKELRIVSEIYKKFGYDYNWTSDSDGKTIYVSDAALLLSERKTLGLYETGKDVGMSIVSYTYIKSIDEPVIIPIRNVYGEISGQIMGYFAINSNSKNVLNAWRMIKQSIFESISKQFNPVNPWIEDLQIDQETLKNISQNISDEMGTSVQLTEDDVLPLIENLKNIETFEIVNQELISIYLEEMEPYFKGQKEYEECEENLESRLKIYSSE